MTQGSSILVTGGTGKTGGALARRLAARGANARIVTSRADYAATGEAVLPLVYGDLRRPETLARAFDGVDRLFLVTPVGPDETDVGMAAIDSAEAAGIAKIVYVAIMALEAMADIPHFAAKVPLRRRLMADGRHTVLEPNFFFQNDLMILDAIRYGGLYPMPVGGAGVQAVDVEDVAAAAEAALFADRWTGEGVPLAGPDLLTGPEMAGIWAEALGRPVAYPGDALDPWIEGMKQHMPLNPWLENDLRVMMDVTQRRGCPATPQDRAATEAILGRTPTAYRAFVERTIAQTASAA